MANTKAAERSRWRVVEDFGQDDGAKQAVVNE